MKDTCSVENLYAIGYLKACPNIKEPVLNEYGWLLNPMSEKYQLSNGHIFLIPEEINQKWIMTWMITKNGSGSCGKTKPDLYIFSYKKAIEEILKHYRLNELDITEIKYIFENKFDSRRIFMEKEIDEVEEKPEEIYVSPFEHIEYGNIGDQLDLF